MYVFLVLNAIVTMLIAILFNLDSIDQQIKEISFGVLKLLNGMTCCIYTMLLVLAIEFSSTKKRILASNFVALLFVISNLILLLIAYVLNHYKYFSIYIAITMSIFVFYFWSLPESPRWLIQHNRAREAFAIFERIAKSNGTKLNLDENEFVSLCQMEKHDIADAEKSDGNTSSQEQKKTLMTTSGMKAHTFIVRTLVLILNWFAVQQSFAGISYYTGSLPGNPYLNFLFSVLVELVSVAIGQSTYERFGRKRPYMLALVLSSCFFLTILFIPPGKY